MCRVCLIIIALNLAACGDIRGSLNEHGPAEYSASETPLSDRLAHFENRFVLLLFAILTYPFVERR